MIEVEKLEFTYPRAKESVLKGITFPKKLLEMVSLEKDGEQRVAEYSKVMRMRPGFVCCRNPVRCQGELT